MEFWTLDFWILDFRFLDFTSPLVKYLLYNPPCKVIFKKKVEKSVPKKVKIESFPIVRWCAARRRAALSKGRTFFSNFFLATFFHFFGATPTFWNFGLWTFGFWIFELYTTPCKVPTLQPPNVKYLLYNPPCKVPNF